ncbi:MAG TPA: GNAT family N-acetyltransferase [Fimbriimonadaceae bacterium]|nr:GNAT family N-acetyltransferase [Fimbriimonadaceae bacterium]HRJ95573.1 GNAT family N-acetyltransferase [Fimbriimonadaceae bacterium]
MSEDDLAGAVTLQRSCFPLPFPEELLWTLEHLTRHLSVFPEGQLVAEQGGDSMVVGSASSLILSEDNWQRHSNWDETVGGFFFANHDPTGTTLFGADISVHPDARGQGIGRALYQARFDLVRRLDLDRFGTACRMPDYRNWASATGGEPAEYAQAVARGDLRDRTLTPLLRAGLSFTGVIPDHMEDHESGNAAAILEWRPR